MRKHTKLDIHTSANAPPRAFYTYEGSVNVLTSPLALRKRCHPVRMKFGTSTVPLCPMISSAHLLSTAHAFLIHALDLPSCSVEPAVVCGLTSFASRHASSRMFSMVTCGLEAIVSKPAVIPLQRGMLSSLVLRAPQFASIFHMR